MMQHESLLKKSILLIFLLSLSLFANVFAQSTITLDNTNLSKRIGKAVYYIKDAEYKYSFEQISSPQFENHFQQCEQEAPNFGNVQLAIWNKFTVVNHSSKEWILVIDSYNIDTLTFYYRDTTGIYQKIKSGRSLPFSAKKYKSDIYAFDLPVKQNDSAVFYFKVETFFMQYPVLLLTKEKFIERYHKKDFYEGLYFGFLALIVLYNLFIYYTVRDKNYLYYIIYVVLNGMMVAELKGVVAELWGVRFHFMWQYSPAIIAFVQIFAIAFTRHFLETKQNAPVLNRVFKFYFMPVYFLIIALSVFKHNLAASILNQVVGMLTIISMYSAAIFVYRKGYLPARFYIIACVFYFAGVVIYVLKAFAVLPFNAITDNAIEIGSGMEMMLFSFALADRISVYKKEADNAQKAMLNSHRENERLIIEQNKMLEVKVKERTSKLENTLTDLKNTQEQLVQSEKLASLGQLSAGIAHEIKNPLNFVNNFSEISLNLLYELKQASNQQERDDIMEDLKQNIVRINHHGTRADRIVKSMLDHVHVGKSEQAPAHLNTLVDEYVTLSYQGIRAHKTSFFCNISKDFDENVKEVNIISAEMGRVLLNLSNNAFYAVAEKKKNIPSGYEPTVTVSTTLKNNSVLIKIKDNGTGIPQNIQDKIFDPFFTTKPTGDGTGLGLSLSFDIIKAHGGNLSVNSQEGEFTEFVISLPV